MADAFVSYSRRDRAAAEAIARAMEARGISVWWDRKIGAGDSFDKTIERELESARLVVVLWSESSVDSEWVKNEAAAAAERQALVPVRIDDVRLPLEFRRKQAVELTGWDRSADDPALTPLLDEIASKLANSSVPRPHAAAAAVAAAPQRRPRASRARWGAAAALGIAVGAAGWLWAVRPGSTDYMLVCQGAGPFGIRSEGPFSARIAFVRASDKASDAMAPGQCAWTDRAVNAQEPSEMCYAGPMAAMLAGRFATAGAVRQHVHLEPESRCLRITSLL